MGDFFANRHLPLVSVKCFPYHVSSSSVIMGDAAHAMVPFYGQGMNCGMEDCLVLEDCIDKNPGNLEGALADYSETRNPDAEAMCDLAMYNYIEMRDLVNKKSFLLRKKLDNLLHLLQDALPPVHQEQKVARLGLDVGLLSSRLGLLGLPLVDLPLSTSLIPGQLHHGQPPRASHKAGQAQLEYMKILILTVGQWEDILHMMFFRRKITYPEVLTIS